MSEKGSSIEAYGVTEIDDYRRSHGSMKSSLRSTLPLPHLGNISDNNEYQEPYQAMKFAPYYSYSTVVMEMQDVIPGSIKKCPLTQSMLIFFIKLINRQYFLNIGRTCIKISNSLV